MYKERNDDHIKMFYSLYNRCSVLIYNDLPTTTNEQMKFFKNMDKLNHSANT